MVIKGLGPLNNQSMSIKVLYPNMIAPITFKVIQWVLASTFRKSSLVRLAPPIFSITNIW